MYRYLLLFLLCAVYTVSDGQQAGSGYPFQEKVDVKVSLIQDSMLSVFVEGFEWKIEYIDKNRKDCSRVFKSANTRRFLQKDAREEVLAMSIDLANTGSLNGLLRLIGREFDDRIGNDTFQLLKKYLPDTGLVFHICGYRGRNTAALEALYLWDAPVRSWQIGVLVSIRNASARILMDDIPCLGGIQLDIDNMKTRVKQNELLARLLDPEIYCQ